MDTLSPDIISFPIFSQLNLSDIDSLVQINHIMAKLAGNQVLWQVKTKEEFGDHYVTKPEFCSWRHYYRLLTTGRAIPLYYNGDRIAYVPLRSDSQRTSLAIISQYVEKYIPHSSTFIDISFINNRSKIVSQASYMAGNFTEIVWGHDSITRILMYLSDHNYSKIDMISRQIFSPEGNPPIYGIGSPIMTNFDLCIFGKGDSIIYDLDEFTIEDLRDILYQLFRVTRDIKLDNFSKLIEDKILSFLKRTSLSHNQPRVIRFGVIHLIKQELVSIGHYVDEY